MSQPEQASSICPCGRPKSTKQELCGVCRQFKLKVAKMSPEQREWAERQVAKELEKRIGRKNP